MADDEQFSLCWNNFSSNLSAGFHESLCRGDLVDVTLAAEGQYVKAHRLVLSVCSPYFRKLFTQMPANQHAFVFLKDVTHSALKDLIQFMYCGEVNVKQDALPAFISTAEALQIKGLTDNEQQSQSPAKPSTPTPTSQTTVPSHNITTTTTSRPRSHRISRQTYKIESEDSGDENKTQIIIQPAASHQTQPQKRPAQRSITPHTISLTKRIKNSDPLEATEPTQITVQTVTESKSGTETEFIDLPIDIPAKAEPDYNEEGGDDNVEQEAAYVEDDSYADMKYDESYFTENDESGANAGATASGTVTTIKNAGASFSDSYVSDVGDQSATEAQGELTFIKSPWATPCLVLNGFIYNCHSRKNGKAYWRCHNYSKRQKEQKCRARCVVQDGRIKSLTGGYHNHMPHTEKINKILQRNLLLNRDNNN